MMSDGSEEMHQYFIRFWQYAERTQQKIAPKLLFAVRPHWRRWLSFNLSEVEQGDLKQRLTMMPAEDQEEFIRWINDYANNIFLPTGATRVLLGQLASLPEFESWRSLDTYAFGGDGKAVKAIILPEDTVHNAGPNDTRANGEWAAIKDLEVALLSKESDEPNYKTPNWEAGDLPLNDVRIACMSLLSGPARLNIVLCWLLGWTPRSKLFYAGLAVAWLLVLFLLSPISSQFDVLLPVLMSLLVIFLLAMIVVAGSSVIAEIRIARKWADLLRGNDIYAVLDDLSNDTALKIVEGGSFGLSLAVAILLALYKKSPVTPQQSWLWGKSFEEISKRIGSWSLTGGLAKSGRVTSVGGLSKKIAASEAHPEIADMVIPSRVEVQPRFIRWAADWIAYAFSTTQITEPGKLRVHRTGHLVQSILSIGGLVSKRALLANTLLVSLLILVAYAFSDIRSIVVPPAGPEFIYKKCLIENRPDGSRLLLYFATSNPAYFKVRLSSSYWADREVTLEPAPKLAGVGEAELGLFKLDRPATADAFEGEVELQRPRRFLWREYAPVTIERDTLRHILSR